MRCRNPCRGLAYGGPHDIASALEANPAAASFFDTLANHNHVEMATWRTCVSKHLTLPTIESDYDRARRVGANSTPTFIVGATKLASADADVAGALDAALAAKGK